ncbi:MAG: transporter [Gammaproteobacteria bacterium]|nr:transporter [Gammaproteobacteria bacterium]
MRILPCLLAFFVQTAFADGGHQSHPDMHAPIGVMGDHIHKQGEFMFSYRFMHMDMSGNRKGSDQLSSAEVLNDFLVSPLDMSMDMHMLGGMYAPSDNLTLMAMLPYVELSMDHLTRMGAEFTTTAKGIGDVRVTALYQFFQQSGHKVHLNFGLALPSGNIDERDDTPLGNVVLPYPMQIGSGTYDLLVGLTYNASRTDWSWGAQVNGTFRLENNDENYSLGDRGQLSAWLAKRWNPYLSTSLRLDGQAWAGIEGADNRIGRFNPMGVAIVPTAQPDLRAGSRIDLLLGFNLLAQEGVLKGHRLAFEVGVPVHQNLDGPQLESDWLITLGWQKAF